MSFLSKRPSTYRNKIDLLFSVLRTLQEERQSKFKLQCAVVTDSRTISKMLQLALEKGLITYHNREFSITIKGIMLLRTWLS